jgi:16S rRNA (adenine1518-N6/adenine1519-N6)-dimethyltransferase
MIQLRARKLLGQHFLRDESILKRIVEVARISSGDKVIEIGPGTGFLTQVLLSTPLQQLTAFELDERAIPELRSAFASEGTRFEIVEGDFLSVNLEEFATKSEGLIRVVGNIPYYITSPILFKLIDSRTVVRDAVLLVQLEVAERLVAKPRTKAYGIPTVLANFFGEVEFLFKVKAGSFSPPPKVDSAVVRIDFERGYFARTGLVQPEGFVSRQFQTFVRGLFRMRRKTIRNNLKGLFSQGAIESIEKRNSVILGRRAEELTIPELLELYSSNVGEIQPLETDLNPDAEVLD